MANDFASWPSGIQQAGRVVDDLVEFCDLMPTLCEATGAKLPAKYPGDGTSLVSVLQEPGSTRKKDWIYIWYRGQVMVRNKRYSLVAKTDGSDATLTRYQGPFDGKKLADADLSNPERVIKKKFEATLAQLAKTRLSGVSQEGRAQVAKPKKTKNNKNKKNNKKNKEKK